MLARRQQQLRRSYGVASPLSLLVDYFGMEANLAGLYDESVDPEERRRAFQAAINSGQVWKLEGAAGRAAMQLISSGQCALGHQAHKDYWGNLVPSRHDVKPGSKGSAAFVEQQGFQIPE